MKNKQPKKSGFVRLTYEMPTADIVIFLKEDVISTSGPGDKNQGAWDPQTYRLYPNY